jgi:hypothetical protein
VEQTQSANRLASAKQELFAAEKREDGRRRRRKRGACGTCVCLLITHSLLTATAGERDATDRRTGGLSVDYTPAPRPHFDRSTVCDPFASLITFALGRKDKAQALEIAAGARLHNVIVAAERSSKELLTQRVSGRTALAHAGAIIRWKGGLARRRAGSRTWSGVPRAAAKVT